MWESVVKAQTGTDGRKSVSACLEQIDRQTDGQTDRQTLTREKRPDTKKPL